MLNGNGNTNSNEIILNNFQIFTKNINYYKYFELTTRTIKLKCEDFFSIEKKEKKEFEIFEKIELKNILSQINLDLLTVKTDEEIKKIVKEISNENNIWIILRFIFDKYEGYLYNENTRLYIIAKFHLIFQEIFFLIFDFKLNSKIKDEDLFSISYYLNEKNFAKMFLICLFEYLVDNEFEIDNRLIRVFGGFMKVNYKILNKLFYIIFII
jgi:hypothetical protein